MRSTIYKDLRSRKTPSGTAFLRNSVDAVDLIGLMVYILTIVSTLQSNQRGEHIMETYTFFNWLWQKWRTPKFANPFSYHIYLIYLLEALTCDLASPQPSDPDIQGTKQSVEIDDVGMDFNLGHVLVEAVGLQTSVERHEWEFPKSRGYPPPSKSWPLF